MSEPGENNRGASGRLDFGAGVLMAALSLYLFFWFIPTFAPGEGGPGQIAPSFFPRFSIAVVFCCATIITATSFRNRAARVPGEAVQLVVEIVGWSLFALVLIALLQWAGFVPAGIFSVLSGVALTRYRKNYLLIGVLAVGLPILLDRAVWWLFTVELP